ncbi:MAG: hypothetical protein ACE5GX_16665 [Thermoanaerobaculia bacterium]
MADPLSGQPARLYATVLELVSVLRDGHMDAYPPTEWESVRKVYPLKMVAFPDGLYVAAAAPAYRSVVGSRVVRFGSMPVLQAIDRMSRLVPSDNEPGRRELLEDYLRMPALHYALGLSDAQDSGEMTVELAGGDEMEVLLSDPGPGTGSIPVGPPRRPVPEGWVDSRELPGVPPLWQRSLGSDYWFEYVRATDTVYFQFLRVRDGKESLEGFSRRLFRRIAEVKPRRLVVDLRWNRGGDSRLTQPLLHGILRSELLDRPGSLFVLTSNYTFSAAVSFAADLERHTHAIFVGEATAAPPNYSAEARLIELPNSGIEVECSTAYWQHSDPRDRRRWIQPDITAPITWEAFVSGRDPAMALILHLDLGSLNRDFSTPPVDNWSRRQR